MSLEAYHTRMQELLKANGGTCCQNCETHVGLVEITQQEFFPDDQELVSKIQRMKKQLTGRS